MANTIQKIQLKRGAKNVLEAVLKDKLCPALGEPIYEVDTKQLKIGDGIHDYKDLSYYGNTGGSVQQLVFDNIYSLPTTGSAGTIYIVSDGNSYIWDSAKLRYKALFLDNRQFYSLSLNESGEIIGAERQIDAGNATANYEIENFIINK